MGELTVRDYAGFLVEIKERIRRGQYQALRAANKALLELYWDIGESIHPSRKAWAGDGPCWRPLPATCRPSSQGGTGFPPETCGT
jgi:hypothetical protein